MSDIQSARNQINEIDKQMSQLFEKRMQAASAIAQYKKEHGLQIFDPTREAQVIERNSQYVSDLEIRSHYVTFLKNLMDLSKTYQHSLIYGHRVAYSGVPGAFASLAAKSLFPDCEAVPCSDFEAAYRACENGECDLCVLPLENNVGGDVGTVIDLAFYGSLYINDIYEAKVVQNLVACEGAQTSDIRTVISHPQALSQCAKFIREHGFETKEAVNTAVAAKMVKESGRKDIAAIASEQAAQEYGLCTLAGHINESDSNSTRFAVFSRVRKQNTIDDNRFIMMFTVGNTPGALAKAISAIGEHDFNLRALKSRPVKDSDWGYYFYVEGEGNIDSFEGRRMISKLEPNCVSVKIIGSYKEQ